MMKFPNWWPWVSKKRLLRAEDEVRLWKSNTADARAEREAIRADRAALDRSMQTIDDLCMRMAERNLPMPERIEMCDRSMATLMRDMPFANQVFRTHRLDLQGYHKLAVMGIEIQAGAQPGSIVLTPKEAR